MTEAVEEQGVKKAAPVGIDPDRLAATFADFGLGVPAAITELLGGGARSFRIDRVDGQPVVLKVFNDALPYATGKETYASQLLRDLDVPMTRFLASDETRTRMPFRYTIANYLPGRQVMTFKDAPDVGDLYRQMGEMLRKLHTVPVPGLAPKVYRVRGRAIEPVALEGEHAPGGEQAVGLAFHDGWLYLSHEEEDGSWGISRFPPRGGVVEPVLRGVPPLGDHYVNYLAFDRRGDLYFGIGSATNAGVAPCSPHSRPRMAKAQTVVARYRYPNSSGPR